MSAVGLIFPQGVCRLYLGLLSISHWLLHGEHGQKELVSLTGNLRMSDKASATHLGKEGSNRTALSSLSSGSFPKEGCTGFSCNCKSCDPVGFCLPEPERHW